MTHAFKIGMEVFIDHNNYGSRNPMQLCTVEKVTATQFTAGGQRFKPQGNIGWLIGSGRWNTTACHIATPEMQAKNATTIKRRKAEDELCEIARFICRLRDDEAIAAFDLLPQSIKDKVQS